MWITAEAKNGILSFECKKVILIKAEEPSGCAGWVIGFYDGGECPTFTVQFDNEQDARFKYDIIMAEIAGEQSFRFEQKDVMLFFEGLNY